MKSITVSQDIKNKSTHNKWEKKKYAVSPEKYQI